jgi:TonB family protein
MCFKDYNKSSEAQMTGSTGKKILLVDYEVSKMKATEDFLNQAGFDVVKAFDGLDALEKFSEEQPDLVLLSAMLPKLHGFEVCKAIKHSDTGRETPVLITTSVYKSYKYKRQAMKDYLADDYILKPFNYEELLAKIREHLGLESLPNDTGSEPDDTESKRADKKAEKTTGEFDSLLDQTLETLLTGTRDKSAGSEKAKGQKKGIDPDNLDEILESTLSGLLSSASTKKSAAKPPIGKKPKPEMPLEPPEEMKTIELSVPKEDIENAPGTAIDSQQEPRKPEPDAVPVKPESSHPEVESIEEQSLENVFDQDKQSELLSDDKKSTSDVSKDDEGQPLNQIIDEAIASFDQDISADKDKDPVTDDKRHISSDAVKDIAPQSSPDAELELDGGSSFGKYKLIEKIAVGGMAEMWKAKQIGPEGFEKVVALKRILPSLSENEDFITMFIDEGKVAAQLTHPNIAQIYELGETDGSYYLAMEYIAGKDLRSIMRLARKENKHLAIPQAALIACKLLSGLNYAHRKKGFNNENLNIVHRDVSPQNVLISYEGEVKLVDFGIAKAAAKNSITLTGALKGKILYMSPEQAWGQTVDKRSDVFSLGTLLYEMLTGKRVFIADNEMAILQKVREWNPPPPSAVNARISSRLDSVILKAMEKDPDKRYQTAEEMREDLEAFLLAENPPKKLMDLGFFMRALFKDQIQAEMPELLDESISDVDPFAMETAKTPVPFVSEKQDNLIETGDEPPSEDMELYPAEPEKEVLSEDLTSETPEPVTIESPGQTSSSDAEVDSGHDEPLEPVSDKIPTDDEIPVSELSTDNVLIDDDFLKPSRKSFKFVKLDKLNKKLALRIAGGLLILLLIIAIFMMLTRTKDRPDPIPAVIPTPTVDAVATAAAQEATATAAAMVTETPTPEPTETATPVPIVPIVADTPPPPPTPTPTFSPTPTETPVPTDTPEPTVTPTFTPTPIQAGAYVEYPDVRPEILTRTRPDMPRAARHMGVEGNVTLRVLVSETGSVLDIETVLASEQLERSGCVKAAHDAVKNWVFQPATHQGVPVKTHYNLVVPFRRR